MGVWERCFRVWVHQQRANRRLARQELRGRLLAEVGWSGRVRREQLVRLLDEEVWWARGSRGRLARLLAATARLGQGLLGEVQKQLKALELWALVLKQVQPR